jgi:hypothetical protein
LAAAVVAAIVLVMVGMWVLRAVKAPVSSADTEVKSTSRPGSSECASLIGLLTGPSTGEPRMTPEIRDKIRQCLQRR